MDNMRRFLLLSIFVSMLIAILLMPQAVGAQSGLQSLDGIWQGTGSNTDDLPFTVTLTIQNESLTGFLYQFPGTDGIVCHAVTYSQIPLVANLKYPKTNSMQPSVLMLCSWRHSLKMGLLPGI